MKKEGRGSTAEMTPAAQGFLRQHIRAVWQLELLLFFRHCDQPVTVVEVCRALRLEPLSVEDCVKTFVDEQILYFDKEQRYRYLPKAIISQAIDEVARNYNERRMSVINFIYAKPMNTMFDN